MLHEGQQLAVGVRPIEPAGGVVLAIGVVVALLAVADLVAGIEQRRALGQQQGGEHRALDAGAGTPDRGVIGRPVIVGAGAEVGGDFVGAAGAVVLAVGVVVIAAVADHVGQRVAVVHGDEIDAGQEASLAVVEQVARGGNAARVRVGNETQAAAPASERASAARAGAATGQSDGSCPVGVEAPHGVQPR